MKRLVDTAVVVVAVIIPSLLGELLEKTFHGAILRKKVSNHGLRHAFAQVAPRFVIAISPRGNAALGNAIMLTHPALDYSQVSAFAPASTQAATRSWSASDR